MRDADIKDLVLKYDTIFRLCALRFCRMDSFEDFVQEGILSFLERSSKQYSTDNNFEKTVIKNCLRYQRRYYLNYYSDYYDIFNEDSLIEEFNLNDSLFGDSYEIDNVGNLDYEESLKLCKSFVENTTGKLKTILISLYNLR